MVMVAPQGGQFILALNPEMLAGAGWADHSDAFFDRLTSLGDVRLPGARRFINRQNKDARHINKALIDTICADIKDPSAILA